MWMCDLIVTSRDVTCTTLFHVQLPLCCAAHTTFQRIHLALTLIFMSIPSIALRRLPLLANSSALPRARLITSHLTRSHPAFSQARIRMDKDQSRGESTTGISEWKQRAPYRVHEKADNFDVKYEANCHCGKVKYQLSRREPLDSKLCHCTTCQTQHGK